MLRSVTRGRCFFRCSPKINPLPTNDTHMGHETFSFMISYRPVARISESGFGDPVRGVGVGGKSSEKIHVPFFLKPKNSPGDNFAL